MVAEKMCNLAFAPRMIYNVYQGENNMQVTISKWGNSLGIRIPVAVANALSLKSGDSISYELKDNALVLKKEVSTKDMFKSFYGKSIDELTTEELGPGGEISWGGDVGGEVF